jgi:hypothetical protein
MKIKPKKMLAGGFLLSSKVIRNVMKVIGKDNAKVIAAKKISFNHWKIRSIKFSSTEI